MVIEPLKSIPFSEILAAQKRIAGAIVRTPLIQLNVADTPAEIFLKLETLQPISSFKLRGAGNAMLLADSKQLNQGVWTVSAGNMAQAVAWHAARLGIACTVVVPDHAPQTKLAAFERLGGIIVKLPYDEWLQILVTHTCPGMEGLFIHPVSEPAMIAGSGTIGLEIWEDLPDVEAVVIPFGGGGLSCGIASALRALKPETRVYACEVETAAPLAASLAVGAPQEVQRQPSFVDGIGAPVVLQEMWPLASRLLDGSVVVSVAEVAAAIKLLVERHRIVVEGAGPYRSPPPSRARLAGGKWCALSRAETLIQISW